MPAKRFYRGADIPMPVIRRYVRQIAKQFHPEKIILFGSRACGTPHEDSDVDMLVVMQARNELDQAVKITSAIEDPFLLDLIVRTPRNLKWRLDQGDWFLREITILGKTLYDAAHARVGTKGRGRPGTRGPRHKRAQAAL
jgi:predicted nucleotidyltransferase